MSATPVKPGYKTLAFYASLVLTVFGGLAASGTDVGGLGAIGFVITSLGAAGYTAWRSFKKSDDPKKPAWKTTEFWLSIGAAIVAGVYASGVFSDGSQGDKVIGFVATLLALAGYTVPKPSKA